LDENRRSYNFDGKNGIISATSSGNACGLQLPETRLAVKPLHKSLDPSIFVAVSAFLPLSCLLWPS